MVFHYSFLLIQSTAPVNNCHESSNLFSNQIGWLKSDVKRDTRTHCTTRLLSRGSKPFFATKQSSLRCETISNAVSWHLCDLCRRLRIKIHTSWHRRVSTFPRRSDRVGCSCWQDWDSSTRQISARVSWYPVCWTSSRQIEVCCSKTR